MKYVDEFRDPQLITNVAREIARWRIPGATTGSWRCAAGTRTRSTATASRIYLPPNVELIHGPGCPVCVLPMGRVDDGLAIAEQRDVIMTAFGDMMRVPGTRGTPLELKARGVDIRMVYSPLDALRIAQSDAGKARRLFRDRLRNHRAVDGADARARKSARHSELLGLLQSRHDRTRDSRDFGLSRHAIRRRSSVRGTSRR